MPILTNEERIGTILADKYKIVRVLGEGGMGVVFEGRHEFTQRRVAVKLLHAHLSKNEAMVQRFLREARAAASLKHRNVVDVLDMGREVDGQVYLVLEFLTGEPLSERLRREVLLEPDVAAGILLPIMSALRAAHARGIVHRDIKPENLFIARDEETGEEVPKLLDFGIAKIDGGARATSTGEAIGTPAYMSPEQATNAAVVDARADIWSMGVLWFETLTGRLPYEADTVMQMLAMLISTDPLRLRDVAPHVPEGLARAVERAMVRDREGRWPSLDPFINAVRECFPEIEARVSATAVDASSGATASVPERTARDARDPAMVDTAPDEDAVARAAALMGTAPAPDAPAPPEPARPSPTPAPRRPTRFALAAVVAVTLLGVGAALALRAPSAPSPARAAAPSAPPTSRAAVTPTEIALPAPTTAPSAEADAGARSAAGADNAAPRVAQPVARSRAVRARRAAGERAAGEAPVAREPEAPRTEAPGTPERVRVMNW